VADLLAGYTSEADSREVQSTLTGFPGVGLDAVLLELERLMPRPGNPDTLAFQLFDDLERGIAEELRQHFFDIGGRASSYAAIYTARKVRALLGGYTSHADSSSILW